MDLSDLSETPQNVEDLEISKEQAEKIYLQYINAKKEVLKGNIYKNADLVKIGYKFMILDHDLFAVTYYMQMEERKVRGRKAAYQSLVWRDVDKTETTLLPIKIFFDVVFPKYGLAVTDRMQSSDGRRFWSRAVARALADGLFAYFVDLNLQEPFVKITSAKDIANMKSKIWGDTEGFQARLLLISKTDLSSASERVDFFGMPIME